MNMTEKDKAQRLYELECDKREEEHRTKQQARLDRNEAPTSMWEEGRIVCRKEEKEEKDEEPLTYRADRRPTEGTFLGGVQTREQLEQWIKDQKTFRRELRKCRDALQSAYDRAVTPSAIKFMEEYLRSVCMIDTGLEGLLRTFEEEEEEE